MRKYLNAFLVALFAGLFSTAVFGQNEPHVVCGSDEYHQQYVKEDPKLAVIERQMNASIDRYAERADDTSTIIIPVVFHVIHVNGPENISEKVIHDQIATLNEAYQKRNKDTVGVSPEFKDLIGNAHIEFRLATQTPWGHCTDGIDRVYSAMTNNANNAVKALAWWDSRKYLNIWVCNSLEQTTSMGILAGYAQFPWDLSTRPSTDGIVVGYQYVGKGKKTLVHEIGHYLGLYHTFQDGCMEDPSLEGDHVSDTPPVLQANFGCQKGLNSCHNDSPDLPDMIENYMDYTDCTHMFTKKQTTRMRWYLKGARSEMISQDNYNYVFAYCPTAIHEPAPGNMRAEVYPNPSSGDIALSLPGVQTGQVSIEVFDVAGKSLNSIKTQVANERVFLSRSQTGIAAPGMYTLKISSAAGDGFVKVIITN